MMRTSIGRVAAALVAGGGLSAGAVALGATAAGAAGNYGPGAVYQVEISANTKGATAVLGNFWVWAALYPAATGATTHGTSNYQETDCIHLGHGHTADAASHSAGDGTWHVTGGRLYLTGVGIIGGLETATFSVPLPSGGYGHASGMTLTVTSGTFPIPPGIPLTYPSQDQIAP